MGRMKEIYTQMQERNDAELALDFDKNNYLDGAWWENQDAERVELEKAERDAQLERDAEIQEARTQGWL